MPLLVRAVALIGLSPFALLAVLALVGVAVSLVFQARESRATREQAFRDANTEMLKMAMDDPDYAECWGGNLAPGEPRAQRQSMYVNMILTQWEMGYETGAIGETHIRALAERLFEGRVPWEFWRRVRELRLETAESRRARRFQRIIDEAFQRAPEPAPVRPRRVRGRSIGRRVRGRSIGRRARRLR